MEHHAPGPTKDDAKQIQEVPRERLFPKRRTRTGVHETTKFVSDMQNVDFGIYKVEPYPSKEQIPHLGETFVDNVLIFYLVPARLLLPENVDEKKTEFSKGNKLLVDMLETFCKSQHATINKYHVEGIGQGKLFDIFEAKDDSDSDSKESVTKVHVRNSVSKAIRSNSALLNKVKKKLAKDLEFRKEDEPHDNGYAYFSYKVSSSQMTLTSVFGILSDSKAHMVLKGMGVFEMDIPTDYGCSFNKQNLADYLESHKDRTVIKNDKHVGRNCLSYMVQVQGVKLRCKIYNKFVQSIESGSVRKTVGFHLADWTNNPDPGLRESIRKSLSTGFTRMEITLYTDDLHNPGFYTQIMQDMENEILDSGKMFFCPIDRQWLAFTENLSTNMCIIDVESQDFLLAMWCDGMTGKIGGVRGKLESQYIETDRALDKLRIWIASHYSYKNGIITICTIDASPSDKSLLEVVTTRYVKDLSAPSIDNNLTVHTYMPGRTYSPHGAITYTSFERPGKSGKWQRKIPRTNEPWQMGFIDTPNISLHMFRNRVELYSKAKCKVLPVLSLHRLRLMDGKKQRIGNVQQPDEASEDLVHAARSRKEFIGYVKDMEIDLRRKNVKPMITIHEIVEVHVKAFKEILGETQVGCIILTDHGTYNAPRAMADLLQDSKEDYYYNSDIGIYYMLDKGNLLTFRREGNYVDHHNNYRPVITNMVTQKTPTEIVSLIPFPNHIKVGSLKTICSLSPESTFKVNAISQTTFRSGTVYMLAIDDGGYWRSNRWFNEEMVNKFSRIVEANVPFEFKTLKM
ncbi:hypothetical protein BDK51DRAFT_29629 [Blyttiomyces helicus]|uniref:Uncharacterized protein n=1 Tax=Blyttiomyces helicus TaxID=388810 RepID=A0A4P9WR00_9FUNG|nr:hypothetical protein BDK51DRAFT_29629 [Blyttiomyces helicus]|eukprot:RKO94633.1 hypothetical protein BDK51DRAFT_29629 [Blyttiomyces helicus]